MRKNFIQFTAFFLLAIIAGCSNSPPIAQITSPAEGSTYYVGEDIQFAGTGQDGRDGILTGGSLVWRSNLDGLIGTGVTCTSNMLSAGTHQITLTATDSDGAAGSDTITLIVNGNTAPVVQITSPAEGSTNYVGDDVHFTGSGNDTEDGVLTGGSLVWSSDLDGQIGTGESCTSNALSIGTHQITLTATDSRGATGTDTIAVTVRTNTAPVALITSPADSSTNYVGNDINFAGSGNDTEDGVLTGGSLVWSSDLDGQIGTGESCTSNALSIGTHQITLTATDSRGATGTDTITITVTPALPDTGQTTSYTGTFGEDSDYTIHPPSYTKLDAVGNELDIGASIWVMARDEVTGLIWEVKTDDSGIHDKDNTYTWQEAQDVFITQLNTDLFGGHADWRRPTIRELAWIVNAESFNPYIDTAFFPNTQTDYYWTATPAHSTSLNAWTVNFDTGWLSHTNKTNPLYVRAVRDGP